MAKKKKPVVELPEKVAEVTRQPITETIEKNYMPYVMTVIVSRAIPDIDGFKPSQRKLLYTMYKMGLLTGARSKSSNVVGQTMKLNPHGDAAIYETMVRLTRGNAALLHPFIDSKGSFGKQYSRDMAYAAPRYTEVKLDPFCQEIFSGIDKNAVDMVPNYDNTTTEPTMLPTTFPNILVSPNLGIAVGMTSNICSFNLAEVCDGTIAMLRNPSVTVDRMMEIIKAPDFSGGGFLIYDKEALRTIYETGVGSVKLRARYEYNPDDNSIDILEIPYSSCIESIMKKIIDMAKEGKIKGVVDVRDAIDLSGFRLTIELKKGTDPDKLMQRLFATTDLEKSFDCNFNVLINSAPCTLGVLGILREWITFRMGCYKRELSFELNKKKDKLHLLEGLGLILQDIDQAIRIIRNTQREEDVVKNLMEAFGLTEIQAEYIAEIKLRHLNREYIINRINELEQLMKEIADLQSLLADDLKIKQELIKQLTEIKKKYGKPRKTMIIAKDETPLVIEKEEVENYPVRVVVTREGYFKKITMQSLKGNDEQKIKETDEILYTEDTDNLGELCVFTNMARMYRVNVSDFENTKASLLGDFLPPKLSMDEGEYLIGAQVLHEYLDGACFGFIYENGKGVKTPVKAYETKVKRKKLVQAFSDKVPCVGVFYEENKPVDVLMVSAHGKGILISSDLIGEKVGRGALGSTLFELKRGDKLVYASAQFASRYPDATTTCRKRKVPTTGNPM
ncbi:MAG: DNA gyrase subunit A [Clostridia bacterium]|nr:DNA gyrase subunit A [Clostridia bacterium]MDY6183884.1 DNA gyrase subunit A [Eubacteriales bacterium]